jgi:hypothetical protein
MISAMGEPYDPEFFNIKEINERLLTLKQKKEPKIKTGMTFAISSLTTRKSGYGMGIKLWNMAGARTYWQYR